MLQTAAPRFLPLRTGVHAGACTDGLVFLDLGRDAYLAYYDPNGSTAGHDGGDGPASYLLGQLVDQGLATRNQVRPSALEQGPRVWRDLPADPRARVALRDIFRFLSALARATWDFNRRPFHELLAQPKGGEPTSASCGRQGAVYASAITQFERLYLFLPFRPLCLFRACFLRHYLSSLHLDAEWMFGVSVFPFRAHCWLASGDLLLSERSDRVEDLTIIYSVKAEAR